MARTIEARWQDQAGTGLEHLVLRQDADGPVAEAALIGSEGGRPYAVTYHISCDVGWRTRSVHVLMIGAHRRLELKSDGHGTWSDSSGRVLPALQGAIDVDLSGSPFTNTLPIRRLQLEPGQASEILAVYISLPELAVATDRQRYTCLKRGRGYRYQAVDGSFERDLEVDQDGLVTLYPGLFRRLL